MSTQVAYRPYVPRYVSALGNQRIQDWILKFYVIEAAEDRSAPDNLIHACLEIVADRIPKMNELPNRKTGFLILHRDDEDVWFNVYWWVYDSILCRLVFRSDPGRETELAECQEPFLSCIWELVPVQYERDGWVKHMLGKDGSLGAYLDQPQLVGSH